MSFAIPSISSITPIAGAPATSATAKAGGSGNFSSLLENAIQSIEQPGAQADQAVQSFLNGENEDIHTVALATQKASLAFDLGLQMRNKVVAAYQEVMKLQM